MQVLNILIDWVDSEEYVTVDLSLADGRSRKLASTEWWRDIGELATYSAKRTIARLTKSTYRVITTYPSEQNAHLRVKRIPFGCSAFTLDLKTHKGTAAWTDESGANDYEPGCWHRTGQRLPRKKIAVTRVERAQRKFREVLASYGPRCAITGEEFLPVLEAAHIVSVESGGVDASHNGLLLRADLHRLYDAGCFTIRLDGTLNLNATLPASYCELLRAKRVDERHLPRIQGALRRVNASGA